MKATIEPGTFHNALLFIPRNELYVAKMCQDDLSVLLSELCDVHTCQAFLDKLTEPLYATNASSN